MLTYEEIKNYCLNYKVENGVVIDKKTNQIVADEDIILKVKTSILIFREAKDGYLSTIQQYGKTDISQENYIRKTMEKFSINNEVNDFGVNKVIHAILNSNGHYKVDFWGDDLQASSKFSFLVPPKKEYGIALLRLKFREKGLDIEDLKVNQDITNFQRSGYSTIIIDFKIKKYTKVQSVERNKTNTSLFQHPMAAELNDLERQKQIARNNNDEVSYKNAINKIEEIIKNNPAEVSPSKWDSMSIDEKIAFVQVKINEAKVLHDEDDFKYWNSNLKSLQNKKIDGSQIIERHFPFANSAPINTEESKNNTGEAIQSSEQKRDYRFYFNEMMKSVNKHNSDQPFTEEQKKQIIGEIFYNEGYMIESLSTEEEVRELMFLSVSKLSGNDFQNRLLDIILYEMGEKYEHLKPKVEKKKDEEVKPTNNFSRSDDLDLSKMINQLKNELSKIQNTYYSMLSDGRIDDDELETLLHMIENVINDGDTLKSIATNKNDIRTISIIIDSLEEEQKKIKKLKNGAEEIRKRIK